MRILITGGTGFIGSRLALKCKQDGHHVSILGMENTSAEKENRRLVESSGVEVIIGSVVDRKILDDTLNGVDIVYHLAAAQHEVGVSDQVFKDVNVTGTQNMLEASRKAGIKKFVYGSTIGVYGNTEKPVGETSVCSPANIYGVTKLEAEKLVLSYKDLLPVVIIRISETYGPGDRRLLKLFKLVGKRRFIMIGKGDNLHQLIYIDDLVNGMIMAAGSDNAPGEIILLVGAVPITTEQMVTTISGVLAVSLPGFHAPLWPFMLIATLLEIGLKPLGIQPPIHRRRMDFFRKNFSFKTNKAKTLIGFTPRYSFEQGVDETIKWYRKIGQLDVKTGNNDQNTHPENIMTDRNLTAQIEPFDTFWEAPENIEKGFDKFAKFYRRNYLRYLPKNKQIKTLVISCGAGYMVNVLKKEGYENVVGIDSDAEKISLAKAHSLNCEVANAFSFLKSGTNLFDLIFAEQEINHLTKDEIKKFLILCHSRLADKGALITHSLNGANPVTGPEALAQNIDHYNTFTEYSLKQALKYAGFSNITVFPLNLYIFYENPVNYIGIAVNMVLNVIFRALFIFYGKDNKLFSKKIAAVCRKIENAS